MGRRGHNEGTIYKRKDGRWCAQVTLGIVNGKTKRKSIYGKTRKEVSERMKEVQNDLKNGVEPTDERRTVTQALDTWLDEFSKPTIRPRTYEGYKCIVEKHLKPALGVYRLSKLGPENVQAMLNEKADHLSPRRVARIHAVLRIMLNKAVKLGWVNRNVATLVSLPKCESYEPVVLGPSEAKEFIRAAQGHRLEAFFVVALALGLRRGEALGIKWEDIDFEDRTLTIRRTLQRVAGKLAILPTKTVRSRRKIRLPTELISVLRAHRARQSEERLKSRQWKESKLVFTARGGGPLEPRTANKAFHQILSRLHEIDDLRARKRRFEGLTLHGLRHSCATILIAQGVPVPVVSEILGHARISTTLDVYSHALPQMRDEAADEMDSVLFGP